MIEPIIAAEIARIGFSARPALAGFFFKTCKFFKRRQQHPGLAWVFCWQAQHAITAPKPCGEGEQRFDHLNAQTLDAPRRRASFSQCKVMRVSAGRCLRESRRDIGCTAMRSDIPGEGEQIAPMAVWCEKRSKAPRISRLQGGFKTLQPTGHQSRIIRDRAQRAIAHMVHGVSCPGEYLRSA